MVRPERRVVPAGASPVRVSARAPGSKLQPGEEIRPSRAECQEPLKKGEENRWDVTISERSGFGHGVAHNHPPIELLGVTVSL